MFTHFSSALRFKKARLINSQMFSIFSPPASASAYPTALFRLYDPCFSTPHFLPIGSKSSNATFAWPQALKECVGLKSYRLNVCDENLLVQELQEKSKKKAPIDPVKQAQFFIEIAELHVQLFDTAEAKKLLNRAVEILEARESLENIKLLSGAFQLLAVTDQIELNYSTAVSHYERSLNLSVKIFRGSRHPSQAQLYTMLGMAQGAVGDFSNFENCFLQVIAGMKACFPDSPARWVDFESSLAIIYQQQGKYLEANAAHKRCCQIYSELKGGEASNCIEKNNWAVTLLANHDPEGAKDLFETAISMMSKQEGFNPQLVKILEGNKALLTSECSIECKIHS